MQNEVKKYFLYPSTIFANRESHLVETILGSCIAVCLYDEKLKIGGINHYMLPMWNGDGLATPKFGNVAIEKLCEKLRNMGGNKLVAKIFGGAHQMNNSINVGDRNIQIARDQLEMYDIRIIAENVGGTVGRKIWYDTGSGKVLMKFLSKVERNEKD